jgi:hypothetical protein
MAGHGWSVSFRIKHCSVSIRNERCILQVLVLARLKYANP